MSMIEKAMKECHLAVKPNKNSKQQALESIGEDKKIPKNRIHRVIPLDFFKGRIRVQLIIVRIRITGRKELLTSVLPVLRSRTLLISDLTPLFLYVSPYTPAAAPALYFNLL